MDNYSDAAKSDQNFLLKFQSRMTVCLIVHVFFKSCEPEIVLPVLLIKKNHICKHYKNT